MSRCAAATVVEKLDEQTDSEKDACKSAQSKHPVEGHRLPVGWYLVGHIEPFRLGSDVGYRH